MAPKVVARTEFFNFKVKTDEGSKEVRMSELVDKAKVTVVVITATKDALASTHLPIYEELYRAYKDRGLQIVAFPCN